MSALADEIERRHYVSALRITEWCSCCGGQCPCDAIRAAAEIRALQASYDEMHTHNELERRALVAEIGELRVEVIELSASKVVFSREPGARGREIEAARIEKEEADGA